ncbi:hypothetical protein DDB_G0274529 [Dictyostelium discoideum AX4]|uniref:hypothetical protein n=1 Tax=Dictyostelium discoideum AX4 TaxID=352472 RepID=UPI0000006EE7|nr:hypothetical protein DDB_G0274529 [Dictyostelium discoideum AX4]EAL70157.1 hypothetical protein DDB_G0274529 [Dictyostelium discoideum AX4]|eukprot:XP_644075.1 hypothetical protein DDB_G0274529 [Dictyostelium discoideum AX4]
MSEFQCEVDPIQKSIVSDVLYSLYGISKDSNPCNTYYIEWVYEPSKNYEVVTELDFIIPPNSYYEIHQDLYKLPFFNRFNVPYNMVLPTSLKYVFISAISVPLGKVWFESSINLDFQLDKSVKPIDGSWIKPCPSIVNISSIGVFNNICFKLDNSNIPLNISEMCPNLEYLSLDIYNGMEVGYQNISISNTGIFQKIIAFYLTFIPTTKPQEYLTANSSHPFEKISLGNLSSLQITNNRFEQTLPNIDDAPYLTYLSIDSSLVIGDIPESYCKNLGWSVDGLDMSIPNSEFSFYIPQGVGKNAQITKSFQNGKTYQFQYGYLPPTIKSYSFLNDKGNSFFSLIGSNFDFDVNSNNTVIINGSPYKFGKAEISGDNNHIIKYPMIDFPTIATNGEFTVSVIVGNQNSNEMKFYYFSYIKINQKTLILNSIGGSIDIEGSFITNNFSFISVNYILTLNIGGSTTTTQVSYIQYVTPSPSSSSSSSPSSSPSASPSASPSEPPSESPSSSPTESATESPNNHLSISSTLSVPLQICYIHYGISKDSNPCDSSYVICIVDRKTNYQVITSLNLYSEPNSYKLPNLTNINLGKNIGFNLPFY